MALFTDVMTVYNSTGEGTWQRTVVKGVQWVRDKKAVSTEKNVKTEKMVENISIDFEHNYGNISKYVEPRVFDALEDKSGYWTLNEETGLDVVVLGEITQELSADFRIKHLRQVVDCHTITSVSDYRNRTFLKHIKVVAE